MDPEVVSQLVMGRERDDTMRRLTPREREVLGSWPKVDRMLP